MRFFFGRRKANSIARRESSGANRSRNSAAEFSVNREQRIRAVIFTVVITDEPVLGSDLDVPVISVSVNEHRADWGFVRIANW